MEDFRQLSSDYLDGELGAAETDKFASGLHDASLDRFVLDSFIHSQLLDWLNAAQPMLGDGEPSPLAGDVLPAVGARFSGDAVKRNAAHHSQHRFRTRLLSLSAIAATLLVAASMISVAYIVASRPVIVAQMTESAGSLWGAAKSEIPAGTLLQAGEQLDLAEGQAVITFGSGTKLWVEAPASLRLDSANQVHVMRGQIAANVPTQARGFTAASSVARFIDLGTEFMLKVGNADSFELFVFEGLVEVHLDERFGEAAQNPLRASEVRAYTFNAATGDDIVPLGFPEGKEMPF